jgi:hypothetical protein|eukprot:SAG25_NODE_502_length_7356_cov_70.227642_5_plen_216_part_00
MSDAWPCLQVYAIGYSWIENGRHGRLGVFGYPRQCVARARIAAGYVSVMATEQAHLRRKLLEAVGKKLNSVYPPLDVLSARSLNDLAQAYWPASASKLDHWSAVFGPLFLRGVAEEWSVYGKLALSLAYGQACRPDTCMAITAILPGPSHYGGSPLLQAAQLLVDLVALFRASRGADWAGHADEHDSAGGSFDRWMAMQVRVRVAHYVPTRICMR